MALSPEACERLTKLGFKINVESGAGLQSDFNDDAFKRAGATIVGNADEALHSDIVLKVRQPSTEEVNKLKPESGLISFLYPAQNKALIDMLKQKNITSFAMD